MTEPELPQSPIEKKRGRIVSTTLLFSEQCFVLLSNAISIAPPTIDDEYDYRKFYDAASLSDDERDGSSEESASDNDDDKHKNGGGDNTKSTFTNNVAEAPVTALPTSSSAPSLVLPKKMVKQTKPQQSEVQIQKYFDDMPVASFRLPNDDSGGTPGDDGLITDEHEQLHRFVEFPSCLVPRRKPQSVAVQHVNEILENRMPQSHSSPAIVIVFVRSGRFAGAVFAANGTCLTHTTSTRYTVRRGQGKAQSAQDGNKKAQSIGSQLRRYGEIQLQADIATTLGEWKESIDSAAFILVSVPKTMRHVLFENTPLRRDDARICRVPLDLGRPSFESVCVIHSVLTRVVVRDYIVVSTKNLVDETCTTKEVVMKMKPADLALHQSRSEPEVMPLTALHIAAQSGDLVGIMDALNNQPGEQDIVAGELCMTPLHYASEGGHAEAVKLLLETGKADPTLVDSRGRVPYFLADIESVRDTFRMMRAMLGEAYCVWDAGAKVGPPLTEDDMERRKEKMAEKRKKKKAKQKERKDAELRQKEEAQRKLNDQRLKLEMEPSKGKIGAECDFCKTLCIGQRRASMFKRLGYSYCSTDCVQKHKRQLAADAAVARMGTQS